MNQPLICMVTGCGIPLPGNDIDTDRIIPARFLSRLTFSGLEDFVFADDRHENADHPFNLQRYQDASILIVGRNFGCGSSREHAPQELFHWGIRAIVGEMYGEIFFSNCTAIGIPCLIAEACDVQLLIDTVISKPETEIELDLKMLTARFAERCVKTTMPEGTRGQFLDGTWNSTYSLLSAGEQIERTANRLPYITDFYLSVP